MPALAACCCMGPIIYRGGYALRACGRMCAVSRSDFQNSVIAINRPVVDLSDLSITVRGSFVAPPYV